MTNEELYVQREQTLVKHFILRKYLERFAHIVGTFCDTITYVDCFSGPWNVRSNELKDSSFAIALEELRKARESLALRGYALQLRCFFLERDRTAFKKLKEFADHISGFVESPQEETQESFADLFGSGEFRSRLHGLKKEDREDALVTAYSENVRETGNYKYVCSAIVLHPEIEKTHFHLIYATRNPKGVEVFKEAERKAMPLMERARAEVQKRKRETRAKTKELFPAEVLYESDRFESLRQRYLSRTEERIRQLLQNQGRVLYDDAWIEALTAAPLVWETDLKSWIAAWVNEGRLRIDGMHARQRVPHRDQNNYLIWLSGG